MAATPKYSTSGPANAESAAAVRKGAAEAMAAVEADKRGATPASAVSVPPVTCLGVPVVELANRGK